MRRAASRAVAALLLLIAASSAWGAPAVTLKVGGSPSGSPTSQTLAVNVGHNWDPSWQLFMSRLGVKGARMFGGTGGVKPRTLYGAAFGKDLNGNMVTSGAAYTAAVAQLRTPAGHNSATAGASYSNPPNFAAYNNALASVDTTSPSGNSIQAQVQALWGLGIEPLVVQWAPCGSFNLTVFTESDPSYWPERWELYKQQYVLGVWAWTNGVRKIEWWNEPDLNAGCIAYDNPAIGASQWLHYYLIQTSALRHSFADLNAEVAAGTRQCGQRFLPCPFNPVIMASAFASSGYDGPASPSGFYLGGPSVANEHTVFGPQPWGTDLTIQNMHAYSVHTYGKTGAQFTQLLGNLDQGVAGNHTTGTPTGTPPVTYTKLPVVVTEHAAHTSGSWNGLLSNADASFEASRLASQVIRGAIGGYEVYIFKFSSAPSQQGGIVKTGIHWADNLNWPFPVGDTTLSAEASRLVIKAAGGGKTQFPYTVNPTSIAIGPANNFRTVAVTGDATRRYVTYVNDCSASTGNPADCAGGAAGTPNATDVLLTIDLSSWGVPVGTLVPVSLAAAGSMGEVSALVPVSPTGTITALSPSGSVLMATVPASTMVQSVVSVLPSADTSLGPQSSSALASSYALTVSTSNTANHATTSVAMLNFPVPVAAGSAALTSAILELTVSAVPSADMPMSVFGVGCNGAGWNGQPTTWAAAPYAINTSLPMTAALTNLAQNFIAVTPNTMFIGHITVPASAAVGQVFRTDVTDYAAACAGKSATVVVVRRLRNPLYTGNAAGNIAADALSGGASVSFYSVEAGVSPPTLRLLTTAPAVATGMLSAAATSGTSGRHLLAAQSTLTTLANAVATAVPGMQPNGVTVSVTGYTLTIDIVLQGISFGTFQAGQASNIGLYHNAFMQGMAQDLSDPVVSNIYLQSASSGPSASTTTRVTLLADGYATYEAAASDAQTLFVSATNPNALSRVGAELSAVLGSTVTASAVPNSVRLGAVYSVTMQAAGEDPAIIETLFNSQVQTGVLSQAVGGVTITGVDPVQAQRFAVTTTLQLQYSPAVNALTAQLSVACPTARAELAALEKDKKEEKAWFGVGIAFIIGFGVNLILIGAYVAVTKARMAAVAPAAAGKGKGEDVEGQ